MQLGIGSYTFPWAIGVPGHPPPRRLTAEQLCRRAVELGVQVVQFADNLPLLDVPSHQLDDIEALALDYGIEIELGTRGIVSGKVDDYLVLARRFGCRFIRLVIDAGGHEPSAEEAAYLLRPVVARCNDAGVMLAIENHDRFPAAVLARMIEELGPGRVGVVLDTVNNLSAGEGLEHVINLLAPYAVNLHLKDFTTRRVPSQMGLLVEGCPLGKGQLNLPHLLKQVQAAGRDPSAIIELWTPLAETLESTIAREADWASQSVQFARRFIPAPCASPK